MQIAPGRVVDGRVEVDGDLPEGSSVIVLAAEGDETIEADAETERCCSRPSLGAVVVKRHR